MIEHLMKLCYCFSRLSVGIHEEILDVCALSYSIGLLTSQHCGLMPADKL